jgi:hypothetical protein
MIPTERKVNKEFASDILGLTNQLQLSLKEIQDPYHATMAPSEEELRATFVDAVEIALRRNRDRIEEIRQMQERAKPEAPSEILDQFRAMAREYRKRPGQQDFMAIGELMQSIIEGERVWDHEIRQHLKAKPDPDSEAWSDGPMEATAPPREPEVELEMKRRAMAEMERHEKRDIVREQRNLRLSAASIARDVLGPRSTTPQKEHNEQFFQLADRIAGWLTNGA